MRIRSYEFYEIRAEVDGQAIIRGDEKRCRDWLNRHRDEVDDQQGKLYLFRLTLVEAAKADRK